MKKIISSLIISILFIGWVSANDVIFDITEYNNEIDGFTYSADGENSFFYNHKKPEDELKTMFGLSEDEAESQLMKNGKKIWKDVVWEIIVSDNNKDFLINVNWINDFTLFKNLEPIAKYDWIDKVSFFNNNKSVIFRATKDDKSFIAIDKEEKTKYDYIEDLLISGDKKHYAYIGRKISEDINWVINKYFLVIDEKVVYEWSERIERLNISSNWRSYAFYEKPNNIIIDWVSSEKDISEVQIDTYFSPMYSKDWNNIYYIWNKVEWTRWNTTITTTLVKNWVEYKIKWNYKRTFQTLNNWILWMTTNNAGKNTLLLDEKELYSAHTIYEPIYNEATWKIAFIGKDRYEDELYIMDDWNKLQFDSYRSIERLTYSKNWNSLAFITRKGNEQGVYFILNWKESWKFDNIYDLVLSDDGKRYAFIWSKNDKEYLVVDWVETKWYEWSITENKINTSNTNKKISVIFRDNKKHILVETEFNAIIKKANLKLDRALNKFFSKIDQKWKDKADIMYNKILSKIDTILDKSKSAKTKELLEYIKDKIEYKIK